MEPAFDSLRSNRVRGEAASSRIASSRCAFGIALAAMSTSLVACSGAPGGPVDSGHDDAQVVDAASEDAGADATTDADAPGDAGDAGVDCSSLPPRDCVGTTAYCGELIQFTPASNDDYDDYPLQGESVGSLVYSYGRRDLVMLATYATAKVACLTRHLAPTFHPLGFGDMSESNGAIPGTDVNAKRHPDGTHENGLDLDVAYYQTGTADNQMRPVCPHESGGNDVFHCTADPTSLDVARMALFVGALAESSRLRLVGVDGRIGPVLEAEIDDLCAAGTLTPTVCTRLETKLVYETTDMGLGLYVLHHTRAHIGVSTPPP